MEGMARKPNSSKQTDAVLQALLERAEDWRHGYDLARETSLKSGTLYVGALGSKKTHAKRIERLLEAGVPAEAIERIHAPIGLDIGAEGPAEIALSIISEIVAAKRGRDGTR